jgi:hypothetical protein
MGAKKMNLTNEICSLEYSKKLKELGVKQESLFYRFGGESFQYIFCKYYEQYSPHVNLNINDGYSAFTAAELGELLPNYIITKEEEPFNNFRLIITKFISVDEDSFINNNFIVNYECDSTDIIGENAWLRRKLTGNIYDPNLANAMAKMLIYLLENKLIKIEELK